MSAGTAGDSESRATPTEVTAALRKRAEEFMPEWAYPSSRLIYDGIWRERRDNARLLRNAADLLEQQAAALSAPFACSRHAEGGLVCQAELDLEQERLQSDRRASAQRGETERLQRAHVAHTAILKDAGRQREEALGREVEDWKAKCEAAERWSQNTARKLYRVLEREGVLLQRVWDLRREVLRRGGRA